MKRFTLTFSILALLMAGSFSTVLGARTHIIRYGDTLWDLCYNKFDIPLWLLERYNSSTNLINLRVSQELIIPIIQSI